MSEVQDYLDLVTSEYQESTNFLKMISLVTSAYVTIQNNYISMGPLFDVSIAVGQQLDVVGQWVGISRNVAIPIAGVYFSWDGSDPTVGWDAGSWQPTNAPTTVTILPDDAYRTLVLAKIAANSWNGTTEGAYAIWSQVFPDLNILIQDNQNMSYDLIILGGVLDSLTQALITQGYIPLKPEGVLVKNYYVPVNPGPAFGWDIENQYVQGWDEGSWTKQIPST